MDQNEIRDYNGQQFSVAEGAALVKELNDRTKSDQTGYNNIDELATKVKALKPTNTPNTGTTINTTNPFGDWATTDANGDELANNATSYALGAIIVDLFCETRLINAASEPTVTGATKIKGSDFVADTNMYMVTWNNGVRNEYHLQEI